MLSERIQRRIDALLDQAESASDGGDWATVAEKAAAVLAIDSSNEDARSFLQMADGAQAASNRSTEPPASATATRDVPPAPAPALPLPEAFAAGRYTVHGFLGEGGSKKVYLAHDTRLDRDVAVAVVEGLDGDGLERVRREAQAVARLGDHPNIVGVFDTGEEDGALYTVYQYMSGGSALDVIARATEHRLPLEQAVRLASQVCAALTFAHNKGVIHRDLKPANVFLDEGGTAKLGDFGLAAALDRTRMTQQGSFLGTATYMAPEQAMGQPPDPRSDLYALGCVLYEMLTGRPPFVGDDTVAVVTQHLNTPPVAPSWHRPDVPPALEALVLRLLEKDPAKRPQSAAETAQALRGVDLAPGTVATSSSLLPPPSSHDPLYRTVFVGREQELKQAQAAFDTALSGNGGLVMVVGEPGIGKTALTEQLATYVAMRGGRALHGNCYEEGSLSLPYLPFVEAMRSYVLDRDPEALRSELGSNAPYVAKIVSEVRERVSVELPPAGDPEDERWRLLQSVTGFLKNASSVQPLCIVLEDLHWSDRGTLDLLNHLARNLQGARLLIVGTYRDVEVDRTHPLSAALADLRRSTNFTRVTLRGLGVDDVAKMLSAIAGREVPRQIADQVHRQTEGNPLFVQEMARWLIEEGHLGRGTSNSTLGMQIPEGLRDVIGKRLSRLSQETNRLLAIAAVIGRDFDLATVRAIAGMDEETLLTDLEEGVRVGVLEERSRVGGVRYRFAHAFFRQALYEELGAARRLRLHQQAGRALEQQYGQRVTEHATELAEHFSHSTDHEDLARAVHYGELAAKRAMSAYDYGEAVRLLERAMDVQEVLDPYDSPRRCDLLFQLADALLPFQPLRVPEVISPEALRLSKTLADRSRALRACSLAVEAVFREGAFLPNLRPLLREWTARLASYAKPGTADEVRLHVALAFTITGDSPDASWEARNMWLRALETARTLDDSEWIFRSSEMLINAGNAPPGAHEHRDDLMNELLRRPKDRLSARALGIFWFLASGTLLSRGDRNAAEAAWRELHRLTTQTRDVSIVSADLAVPIREAILDGRLEEALALGEQAHARIHDLGDVGRGRLTVDGQSRTARLYLGKAAEELVLIDDVYPSMPNAPYRSLEEAFLSIHARRLNALAYLGDPSAGSELRRVLRDRGIFPRHLPPERDVTPTNALLELLEAAILVGDTEIATDLAERLRCLEPLAGDGGWHLVAVARLLGGVAELRGDPAEAKRLYELAVEVSARIRNRPEVAVARFHLARLLLDCYPAERREALDHLDFAISEFQAMKMAPSLKEAIRLRLRVSGADTADPASSIVAVTKAVQAERPNLSIHAAPDGTVTLMFSDIENSTPLNEQMGDAKWMEVLRAHNAVIEQQVKAHHGHVVKTMGDGYMVAFKSAADGLRCAIAIQQALGSRGPLGPLESEPGKPVRVRMGLHTGEMVRDGDDFFGRHVNLAARVAGQASGGEIFVSGVVRELVSGQPFGFDDLGERPMKGFEQPVRVWSVRSA